MIKKLNALILVLLGVMVVVKLGLKAKQGKPDVAEETFVAAEVRNAAFSPIVHYISIPGLAFDNPITNRRGLMLDVVRGVFPNARYSGNDAPDVAWFRKAMSGANSAAILPKEVAEEMGLAVSDTVLYRQQVVVYTQRRNAWAYDGLASLKNLRLGVREDLHAFLVTHGFADKLGKNIRVYISGENGYSQFARAVLSGEVDGYLIQRQGSLVSDAEDWGAAGDMTMNLRRSPAVCELEYVLAVSKANPEQAKSLLAAFEKGYREIETSGELRRIREYYER